MLNTPSFLYFFQLLNNWPRFFVFLWDNTIVPVHTVIPIETWRPSFFDNDTTPIVANSLEEFRRRYGIVEVSACSKHFPKEATFWWEILGEGSLTLPLQSTSCRTSFNVLKQGAYKVSVVVRGGDGTILGAGSTTVQVNDRWIVALGDSFCSGEGNPDRSRSAQREAQWMDEGCHRSSNSWASKVASRFSSSSKSSSTIFTFLCCTGASVESGVLKGNPQQIKAQIEILEEIGKTMEISPDVVLMSVGGNDIGYAEIMHALGSGHEVSLFRTLHLRFMFASQQLDNLAVRLSALRPKRVIFPHYFDPSRDERGNFDASCDDFKDIGSQNLQTAEELILKRLNKLITAKCVENGWTDVDISKVFEKGGVCSRTSRIRSVAESLRLEGSVLGAFHPNSIAHSEVADLAWKALN
ncbi:unnamed protein product, partial [Mesorhabditis belari]|uniref:SGNH hydrolase-type esterase domain-containing protein n=1 Tax=Mesorhabditis belari TaxID=2138241 RepID=A0AAF3J7K9_9BILA